MRLLELLKFSVDSLSPGAIGVSTLSRDAVTKKKSALKADASPSDLASHHTWQEPSASDLTIRNWRSKRQLERVKRRNLDPFEEGAGLEAGST